MIIINLSPTHPCIEHEIDDDCGRASHVKLLGTFSERKPPIELLGNHGSTRRSARGSAFGSRGRLGRRKLDARMSEKDGVRSRQIVSKIAT